MADSSEHDQLAVYSEFKEQLVRNNEGWYETGLPWRGNHRPLQKAFLQIRIKEHERDALRFQWRNEHSNIETYRFTRALFGLTCSPGLLVGVIEQHLQSREGKLPEVVAALNKTLYVDDLLNGGQTVEQTWKSKSTAIEIFSDAKFVLHKWNSTMAN